MKKMETRDGGNFNGIAGNSVGDLNLTPVDILKKYGSRVVERFAVNLYDYTRTDYRVNLTAAL